MKQLRLVLASLSFALAAQTGPDAAEYRKRVELVRGTRGFVALWDFVSREDGPGGRGRFTAHQARGDFHDFALDPLNYVRAYWGKGRAATYEDFPLLGRGPFGQAIRFTASKDPDFRPCLLVPRARLHGSGLDVKGPGRSVSMVVWMVRQSGEHAIAGIWHEGTDLPQAGLLPAKVETGRRQYALFAGLAANRGAVAAHVSENGANSFGDRYARNLAVTPRKMPQAPAGAPEGKIDQAWVAAGFVFDNANNTVTAYLDGKADEFWVDDPAKHPFFQWPAKAWKQAQLRRIPGLQPEEDPDFPPDQFYAPPEGRPLQRQVVSRSADERIEIRRFRFTKVRVTLRRDTAGRWKEVSRELVSLKVNPFWFPHDLWSPNRVEDGGPFTIGRVIHSGRNVGIAGYIGGVAVFGRALSGREMERLAAICRKPLLQFHRVVASGVQGADAVAAPLRHEARPRTRSGRDLRSACCREG